MSQLFWARLNYPAVKEQKLFGAFNQLAIYIDESLAILVYNPSVTRAAWAIRKCFFVSFSKGVRDISGAASFAATALVPGLA